MDQNGAGFTTALRPGMTFDEWAALVGGLGARQRMLPWVMGDALNFGEAEFGERYAQAFDATGLRPSTITVYQWVARAYLPEERHYVVEWSAHRVLASAPRDVREELLAHAEEHDLTVAQLVELARQRGILERPRRPSAVERIVREWARASDEERDEVLRQIGAVRAAEVQDGGEREGAGYGSHTTRYGEESTCAPG